MSDFTKRAGLAKGKICKLIMICSKEYRYRFVYLLKSKYPDLAYYHFLTLFESSSVAGESGAHVHVIDMEISHKPLLYNPTDPMWPVSITLNISLEEYRKLRKEPNFGFRRMRPSLKKAVPMPGFEEIEK